ncbi:MAG: DUF2868 domain-containing protein [Desulfobacteraceae bacterium]|nr:MAG: DUF2868 domain-containing protein [Desulfobacteraceae bacterium]
MKITLKDIIDLEYLVDLDHDVTDPEDTLKKRDREIYSSIGPGITKNGPLVLHWIKARRAQVFKESDNPAMLPGALFNILYNHMAMLLVICGLVLGGTIVSSFLAYHGSHPINVTLFTCVFIILPFMLSFFSLIPMVLYPFKVSKQGQSPFNLTHSMIASLMIKGLAAVFKIIEWAGFSRYTDTSDLIELIYGFRLRTFTPYLYWPLFILTSLFSMGFSLGTLLGALFRVLVRDMAFGWQSTVLSSDQIMFSIVSWMAKPWSWLFSTGWGHPGFEQIQGTRIILKDGISVLATQDLVSWWPFLCLGILCYAVFPRLFLIACGALFQKRRLSRFNFEEQRYQDIIHRMTQPLLAIQPEETPLDPVAAASEESPLPGKHAGTIDSDFPSTGALDSGPESVLLLSTEVFSPQAVERVKAEVFSLTRKTVRAVHDISFDFERDKHLLDLTALSQTDLIIVAQEAWQPPIKGLLHFFTQLVQSLQGKPSLQLLLTGTADRPDLSLAADHPDLDTWQQAVARLQQPNISIQRFEGHDS